MARLVLLALILPLMACASATPPAPTIPLPWNAAIGRLDSKSDGRSCSATLIQPDIIITAAHCIFSKNKLSEASRMRFTPFVGHKPALPGVMVAAILKFGREIDSESNDFSHVNDDWAILRLKERIDYLKPLPVVPYSLAQLQEKAGGAAIITYVGYGAYGVSAGWRQHIREHCQISNTEETPKELGQETLLTNCQAIKGDSGGPILLTQPNGRLELIGVLSGFRRSESGNIGFSFGPLSVNFWPFVPAIQAQP
jgi:protease YdgD